ncbi:hypothetical protein CANARDRAFT_29704 [[Candida] arabinofermentans NRRL YB-2248]|uniref:Histone-lysine N-methyltransferase, H3 lysine-36 specific n=1 Tax=[Candida] arabinofermentans NRRL YB-2248 TaxID=983967 RepID=A0A1E4SW39_9ASCO|nr:hypothetical protein CANARDRAFT_29704 [[Candida] arabinofermentans NRRL YB-2248]
MAKSRPVVIEIDGDDDDRSSTTPPLPDGPQLFLDEPDVTEEALKGFVNLKQNIYNERIAHIYSASDEFMSCDCHEVISDGRNVACGPESECINRLTNIECVDDQCSCGVDCQNQRFQKNETADVSIFHAGSKGYGMRANSDIPAGSLVVEYKGEIVDNKLYETRKIQYDDEGVKHFYFMQIKDNEIIDATKMASIGRFCNHSCDPNAYVEKWVVKKRFRMGIFAKRTIRKGEEITFDYNVDRYGAKPQTCYCGAANCLGVMGGKTQSETFRLLPHAISEALGVKSSTEKKWIKEQKKIGVTVTKDNIDSNVNVEFVKSLEVTPLPLSDISKVVRCLLQPELDFIVMQKVFERINTAEDYSAMVEIFSKLHGMKALSSVLKSLLAHTESRSVFNRIEDQLLANVLDMLNSWPPLKARNTIMNCKLDVYLAQAQQKTEDEDLRKEIKETLEEWDKLEVVYRIPKKGESGQAHGILETHLDERRVKSSAIAGTPKKLPVKPGSQIKSSDDTVDIENVPERRKVGGVVLPPGWEWAIDPESKTKYYFHRGKNAVQWERPQSLPSGPRGSLPTTPAPTGSATTATSVVSDDEEKKRRREKEREREEQLIKQLEEERQKERQQYLDLQEMRMKQLSSIIADASVAASGSEKLEENRINNYVGSSKKTHKPKTTDKDKLEKQWMKLFASLVPNMIKKYEQEIGRDNLKSRAREITHLLAEKELKRHSDSVSAVPKELSADKKAKVKLFVKDYMTRYMIKFTEKKRQREDGVVNGVDKKAKKNGF